MLQTEPQVHRLTVDDVQGMVAAGILDESSRVELLDGVLYDVSPPGPAHAGTVSWLNRHFSRGLDDHEVRVQDVLLVAGGFVSPDLIVVERLPRDRLPDTAELVVEVAVTTHRHDTAKAARYARDQVREYWIVDLPGRRVRVHRRPTPEGFDEQFVAHDGERLQPLVGGPAVDVTELLGPVA